MHSHTATLPVPLSLLDRLSSAQLLLRLALGTMWLSHGLLLKLMTFGVTGLVRWLGSVGYPAWAATPLIMVETLGGLAILLGFHGRRVSLALLPILVGALQIHGGNGWVFTSPGGGWEYPLFLIATTLVHALLGDGRHAVRPD